MNELRIMVEFMEPILGGVPMDKEVYTSFIASKKEEMSAEELAEELETIEHLEEKGWTSFHKLQDGTPVLYDYVIKGFFKDACSMLRRVEGEGFFSKKLTAHKKVIDGLVFVKPRRIPLWVPSGEEIFTLERPLRAQTAQGERVALARSDACPVGTTMVFTVHFYDAKNFNRDTILEWLDYGRFRGFGQWRNGGYGSFVYWVED